MKKYLSLAALALGLLSSGAMALDVRGGATVHYNRLFSSKPSAETRQAAQQRAMENAWESYTASFDTSRMQQYQAMRQEILDNLDQYLINPTIVDEVIDKDDKEYSVVLRVTVNESALEVTLGANSPAATAAPSMFSFVFLAREAESVKRFDQRRTDVETSDSSMTASSESAIEGGSAAIAESESRVSKTVTGGSTLQKADQRQYRIRSGADIDSAMNQVFTASGYEVVTYQDVLAYCGGASLETIRGEFTEGYDMSTGSRREAIDGARACDVRYFAVGTLDVGMQDVDPVSGNQRVTVAVRAQVYDLQGRLPRTVASVGPVQFSGLGPDPVVATRNALNHAAEEGARTIVDQMRAKGYR